MEAQLLDINPAEKIMQKLMAHESHLSYSSLSAFGESPKDFIDYKLRKAEPTDSMAYGSMLHCLILEPGDFENRYLALDDSEICDEIGGAKPRATKSYKEWYAIQEAGLNGRIMVSPVEYRHAKAVAGNVRYNRASRAILEMCPRRELPIEWEYQNFLFKGFIDLDGDSAIADIKSCADASPKKFQRDIVNMDYHLQAAMYVRGCGKPKDFYHIAVDKKGGVSVHLMDKYLLEAGMERYENLIQRFNECILCDGWDQSYDFWSPRIDGLFKADKPMWV